MAAAGRQRPEWAKVVLATVLRHDTPIDVRMVAAGKTQAGQQEVGKIKLARAILFIKNLFDAQPNGDEQELCRKGAVMGAQKVPENKV